MQGPGQGFAAQASQARVAACSAPWFGAISVALSRRARAWHMGPFQHVVVDRARCASKTLMFISFLGCSDEATCCLDRVIPLKNQVRASEQLCVWCALPVLAVWNRHAGLVVAVLPERCCLGTLLKRVRVA